MIRPPISMARFAYDRENQVVHYRTDEKTLSFDPVEFLARLSVHIPNAREQTVRYMGYYSNKSRGMRKRTGALGAKMTLIAIITDYETRKKILKHLGLWNRRVHSPPLKAARDRFS